MAYSRPGRTLDAKLSNAVPGHITNSTPMVVGRPDPQSVLLQPALATSASLPCPVHGGGTRPRPRGNQVGQRFLRPPRVRIRV